MKNLAARVREALPPGFLPDEGELPTTNVDEAGPRLTSQQAKGAASLSSASSTYTRHGAEQTCTFQELLGQLEAEHMRQISKLQEEIACLSGSTDGPGRPALRVCPLPALLPGLDEGSKEAETPALQPTPACGGSMGGMIPLRRAAMVPDWEQVRRPPSCPPPRFLLRVSILGAHGLQCTDWGPSLTSDPYCVCTIPGKPDTTFQTNVVQNTVEPEWNYDAILSGYTPGDSLEFTVKDRHYLGFSDELLGKATLLSSSFDRNGFDGMLELHDCGPLPASLHLCVQVREMRESVKCHPVWLRSSREDGKRIVCVRASESRPALQRKTRLHPILPRHMTQSGHIWPMVMHKLSWSSCMLHPESVCRLFWDMLGILTVITDLVWIPMLVFDLPETTGFFLLGCWTLAYWTLDIIVNFCTGVHKKNGEVSMDWRLVALAYVRGWMLPDLVLVAIEWVVQMHAGSGIGGGIGQDTMEAARAARAAKLMRVARILRLLRLVRLLKLRELLFAVQGLLTSEWLSMMFMVGRNLLMILALNHLLACLWFAIGTLRDDGWVAVAGLTVEPFQLQYLVSLQWSMAQFTPGATPLQPRTMPERVYAVFVLALGLVVATCFVSSITSTFSALWSMQRYETTQAMLLRQFLRQNNISRSLAVRVLRFVSCVLELRQRKLPPSRVHYLKFLSGPLTVELQSELREPQLFVHHFFPGYKDASTGTFQELCTTGLEQSIFAKNDTLFHRRGEAKHMYFVNMGSLVYCYTHLGTKEKRKAMLEIGQWVCEHALWMPWRHVGRMKALMEVDMTLLSVARFCDLTRSNPDVFGPTQRYARMYIDDFQKATSFEDLSVTDLPLQVNMHGAAEVNPDDLPDTTDKTTHLSNVVQELQEAEDVEAEMIPFSDSDSEHSPQRTGLIVETDTPPCLPFMGSPGMDQR